MESVNPNTLRSRKRRAAMTPNERTQERSRYAVKRRVDLVRQLAPDGRCASCGETHAHEDMEVDHVNGRMWHLRSLSPHRRAARYWREYHAGIPMQALCRSCNAQDGGGRRYEGPRG